MDNYFMFYHKMYPNDIYTARVTDVIGRDIQQTRVMVMWSDEDGLDGYLYTKEYVEELIKDGIWVVLE